MTGRKESCWARLKRWISSTKSSVPCPVSRRARAASNTFLRSATPEKIAEICSKCRSVACASSRATVVLPVPGGPQKISEPSVRVSSMRVSAPSGPSRWSWPDHLGELRRPQLVGERSRRIAIEPRGREQARPAALGARAVIRAAPPTSAAAAHDGDAPQPALLAGGALEIAGLGDLRVVDRRSRGRHAGSRDSAPASRWRRRRSRRPGRRDRAADRPRAPATGWRPWRPGTASGEPMTSSSRGRLGRRFERHRDRGLLAGPQRRRAARCRRAPWWRSGSRRHWGPRPPGRRWRRSGRWS